MGSPPPIDDPDRNQIQTSCMCESCAVSFCISWGSDHLPWAGGPRNQDKKI